MLRCAMRAADILHAAVDAVFDSAWPRSEAGAAAAAAAAAREKAEKTEKQE